MGDLKQILYDSHRINTIAIHAREQIEGICCATSHHMIKQIEYLRAVRQAQHVADKRDGNLAIAKGYRLVEKRQSITHGAVGSMGNERHRLLADVHRLPLSNLLKVSG